MTRHNLLEKKSENKAHKTFKRRRTKRIAVTGGEGATSQIAKFLEMLGDGQWHLLEEIQWKSKIDNDQIHKIVTFLREYDFIIMDEKSQRIKLEENVQKFLAQTATS